MEVEPHYKLMRSPKFGSERIFLVKVKEEKMEVAPHYQSMRSPKFGSERILFKMVAVSGKEQHR